MHYYILHTDTLSIPWRTIHFHVVFGLLVLIPVQFDSVDYYFRPTQNQVFHVKQKTSGRSFAMKVLHKVGYFGQNCFQQRWLISDEGCFLPKAFGILLAWGVISGCSNMNIWKAIPDFVLFFWSSVRDGFQLSDTFVIKIMALKVCWDMHSVKHIYIYIMATGSLEMLNVTFWILFFSLAMCVLSLRVAWENIPNWNQTRLGVWSHLTMNLVPFCS